jgi:glycosyltransferase involved in cell wall biosynthesis
MRVLFQNRPNSLSVWGGDTTQMVKTKEALEPLGVIGEISLEPEPDLSGFDLVHIFNVQTAEYGIRQVRNARRQGVPVVLSTIYWDLRPTIQSDDYLKYHSNPRIKRLAGLSIPATRLAIDLYRGKHDLLVKEMLDGANILLPNSVAELEIIATFFSMPSVRARAIVVPNAVSAEFDPEPSEETRRVLASLPEKYLLQVANFDPGKGQLNLLRALASLPEIPVVFVGRGSNLPYFQACRNLAVKRGRAYFVDHVPHGQIAWFQRRAKVHALPSLRESPGLATLEAAVNGANCVVGIYCPVQEYFGEDVWLCDPVCPESIKDAVALAWNAQTNVRLKERILREFTWKHAAETTLRGYKRVLR